MTSQQAQCPKCGHSPLNHRMGVCQVIVTLRHRAVPSHGEPTKAHCGCEHYKPMEAIQILFPDIEFSS